VGAVQLTYQSAPGRPAAGMLGPVCAPRCCMRRRSALGILPGLQGARYSFTAVAEALTTSMLPPCPIWMDS
jgi:hypothetical protein